MQCVLWKQLVCILWKYSANICKYSLCIVEIFSVQIVQTFRKQFYLLSVICGNISTICTLNTSTTDNAYLQIFEEHFHNMHTKHVQVIFTIISRTFPQHTQHIYNYLLNVATMCTLNISTLHNEYLQTLAEYFNNMHTKHFHNRQTIFSNMFGIVRQYAHQTFPHHIQYLQIVAEHFHNMHTKHVQGIFTMISKIFPQHTQHVYIYLRNVSTLSTLNISKPHNSYLQIFAEYFHNMHTKQFHNTHYIVTDSCLILLQHAH